MSLKIITFVCLLLVLGIVYYLNLPLFGKLPNAHKDPRLLKSKNYKDGTFFNQENTPALTEGSGYLDVSKNFFFNDNPNKIPNHIPAMPVDLKNLPEENLMIWFGHSSYLLKIDGLIYVVDPVFSGSASPIPGNVKAFEGTQIYNLTDLKKIDFLIITHDHYDHLDYQTVKEIKPLVNKVICGLGVDAHFLYWGYAKEDLIVLDWEESSMLSQDAKITATTSRHFSGRTFKRNSALWCSYVLETAGLKLYIGGDSGYGKHFAAIGQKYGPFDWAILENGQYNKDWKYIHMMPEEVLMAQQDLGAKKLIPVHSGKFALATHDWNEPLLKISELNEKAPIKQQLMTPKLGELVYLNKDQVFEQWYK